MKAITNTDIRNLIIELKLPKVILEFFDNKCNDHILISNLGSNYYSDPYKILILNADQQKRYLVEQYKPILSCNSDTIFAYDQQSNGYISYSIEYWSKEPTVYTWDGLFVSEILFWYESEIEVDAILHIGNLFGLKYTKDILDDIYKTAKYKGFSTYENIKKWENTMIGKINGFIDLKD